MLWEVSFANLNMLLATIPEYEPADKKKDDDKKETTLDQIFNDI